MTTLHQLYDFVVIFCVIDNRMGKQRHWGHDREPGDIQF